MSASSRGCLKNGCFGCLGLVALGVLAIILLTGVQVMAPTPEVELATVDKTHPLFPGVGGFPADEGVLPLEAADEGSLTDEGTQIGEILPLAEPLVEVEPRAGRLVLDLAYGEFYLRRGEPGEPLSIDADYDSGSFELKEEFSDNGETWDYLVSFDTKGGFLGLLLGGVKKEVDNRITITIPPGHPIELVGEVGIGELEADLGGLWLTQVDLELGVGEHRLSFDEPTQEAMERLKIEGSIGDVRIYRLGNASPRTVSIEHSIGSSRLDLTGAWRNDSTLDVDFTIGDFQVEMPDNAHVVVDRKGVSVGEVRQSHDHDKELPADAPTLTLKASGSIGELSIH